ncbi:MAG: hypothetical protein ABJA87_09145 [bacterium]
MSATTVEQPTAAAPPPPNPPGRMGARRVRLADNLVLTALAVLTALVIGALLMIFSDDQTRTSLGYFFQAPSDFFSNAWYTVRDAYVAMFKGAIFDPGRTDGLTEIFGPISSTIFTATPLICAGLGISLAFRSGLFNIGGQGQVIAGAMASGYVGFAWSLPPVLHLVVAILAGVLAGGFWGFLAGFLKARTGAHEVITTIMLNYIALYGLRYILQTSSVISGPGGQASKPIVRDARLPHLFGSGLDADLGILLALAAAVLVWWMLTRSTVGFRLRAVGANPAAARTAGMSVAASTMIAMALAGALSGLGGTTLALGGATSYQVTPAIDSGVGFDAITVALLGRSNPWGTVAAGLLFGALRQGGARMQAEAGVGIPIDLVTVIQAVIVIFVAAPALTRAIYRLRDRGAGGLAGSTSNLAVTVTGARAGRYPRHVVVAAAQVVAGLIVLVWFAGSGRATEDVVLQLSLPGARFDVGTWTYAARPMVIVLGLVILAVAALTWLRRTPPTWSSAVAVLAVLFAFMSWSLAGSTSGLNLVSLLQGALFPAAIPLILGALAGVLGERAGVVNVAIEGQLLLGAFVAAAVGTLAGSVWIGALGGALAGVLVGALLAVMAIRYFVDQVIIGVVLNLLVTGVTSFLFIRLMTPHPGTYNQPEYFHVWKVPVLGDIPLIGPVFFNGTIFLYFSYAVLAAVQYGLFHTRWGLRLRAVGEHPRAADTVGIDVLRTRYVAVLLAGAIAGLGGAFLVLGSGSSGTFGLGISAGKGFIALAAVIFGKWSPRGAVLAALLFGFADQLQSLLSQAGTPINSNLLLTLPYVVTLFAVAGFIGRVRAPAADGQPYHP